ncbi:MAG: hypothetical protein V4511_04520 [Bacteroidota bacterium]
MNKSIFYLSMLLLLACNSRTGLQNENGTTFDSDKLKGKYKLDISEIVAEVTKPKSEKTSEKIANGIVGLASVSISAEINFYGNGKGVWRADFGWLGALMNEKNQTEEFEYRIENDSILTLKNKQLTIRKFSDSFDFVELVSKEENKKYIFNKIAE